MARADVAVDGQPSLCHRTVHLRPGQVSQRDHEDHEPADVAGAGCGAVGTGSAYLRSLYRRAEVAKTEVYSHRRQLQAGLRAEDLSGDTLMVEISTVTKQNLDKLVESVVLQAELLDLKTDFETEAKGIVIESKILFDSDEA